MLFGFKKRILPNLATHENRWWALVVIALGLAIGMGIDNSLFFPDFRHPAFTVYYQGTRA